MEHAAEQQHGNRISVQRISRCSSTPVNRYTSFSIGLNTRFEKCLSD